MARTTIRGIQTMKKAGSPIPMVTAYDYTAARLVEAAGIPMILVGDSIGQTTLGYENTIPVTVDDIVRATAAVVRGSQNALIIADMPFMSYQASVEDAMHSAGRLVKEGGAQAVKLEGGAPVIETIKRLTDAGFAVMGHLGLTPQSVNGMGGYGVQGRSKSDAQRMSDDALAIQGAGAFSVVLELIPADLAQTITGRLEIPTIGIGAGLECDGQVQVFHDILGLSLDFTPRHAKKYAQVGQAIADALGQYADDVKNRRFPTEAQMVRVRKADKDAGKTTEMRVSGGG
jgi:3-methyl-2-oxobutanoate hydroxymethyltransferase